MLRKATLLILYLNRVLNVILFDIEEELSINTFSFFFVSIIYSRSQPDDCSIKNFAELLTSHGRTFSGQSSGLLPNRSRLARLRRASQAYENHALSCRVLTY